MKLIKHPYVQYGQLGQYIPLLMALCKRTDDPNTVKETHYPVICRDFFGDLLLFNKYKIPYSIYYFQVNEDTASYDQETPIMSLKFPSQEIKQNFLNNYSKIIWPLESNLNLQRTAENPIDNDTLVISFDPFWLTKAFLISTYTFLLKACCYEYIDTTNWLKELTKKITNYGNPTPESDYAQQIKSKWKLFYENLHTLAKASYLITGWPKEHGTAIVHTVHDCSGITAIITRHKEYKTNAFCVKFNEIVNANKKPVS